MKARTVNRRLPKRVLILCEGESEVNYFKSYAFDNKNRDRLRGVEIDIYQPVNFSPVGLIKEAKQRILEARRDRLPYEAVWAVFDKDGHANIANAFEMARTNTPQINIAFSAICFEVWVLLHFEKRKMIFSNSETVIKYLYRNCGLDYSKGKLKFSQLHHLLETALANCVWLHKQNKPELDGGLREYDLDVYTAVDLLMVALEELNKPGIY